MMLAESLREATRSRHAEAERSGVMAALLRGALPLRDYCAMLRNLHAINAALETSLARRADHACLAPLHEPRLWRSKPLAADLELLAGNEWETAIVAHELARAYAQRLVRLADESPERLVAHAYTRYLADLSGGRVLACIAAKAFHLHGEAGLAFYQYEAPGAAALAMAFRSGLNAVPNEPSIHNAIIEEACSAFEQHTRLFAAMAPDAG